MAKVSLSLLKLFAQVLKIYFSSRAMVNAKGGAAVHVLSGAPSLLSLSDPNIVNRLVMRFVLRAEGKD